MISLRLFYFLSYGALGSLFPFLPLLLAHRDLTPTQIGWVMVVVPVGNLLFPPIWGAAADALRARLPLLRAAAAGSGLTVLLLLAELDFATTIFAVAMFSLFRAPLTSLADAASVEALGGCANEFSRVRVWGSLGFALFVMVLGWLGASTRPALLVGSTGIVYLLACTATLPLRADSPQRQHGIAAVIGRVLRRGSVLTFLVSTAAYYFGHSMYDVYFGLHAKALGLGDPFVGTAWAIGVGVEIVLLLVAPRLLPRVRNGRMLVGCAAVAALRWWGLAHLTSAAALLVLQSLHGITFGLWYLSLVSFVQSRADDRTRTTLQSIALSCVGFGTAGGYLIGGSIFDAHGGTTLYSTAAAAAIVALFGYALSSALVRNRPNERFK